MMIPNAITVMAAFCTICTIDYCFIVCIYRLLTILLFLKLYLSISFCIYGESCLKLGCSLSFIRSSGGNLPTSFRALSIIDSGSNASICSPIFQYTIKIEVWGSSQSNSYSSRSLLYRMVATARQIGKMGCCVRHASYILFTCSSGAIS